MYENFLEAYGYLLNRTTVECKFEKDDMENMLEKGLIELQ